MLLNIDDQLSLKMVFVLYRLSYLLYQKASKLYSAVFQYKKLLYVLRDTITSSNKYCCSYNLVETIGSIPIKAQIAISGVSNRAQLTKYRFHTEGAPGYAPYTYNNLSTSPDVKEIVLLVESIRCKIDTTHKTKIKLGAYSTISSMFARTLELKFQSDEELKKLKAIRGQQSFMQLYHQLMDQFPAIEGNTYEAIFKSTVNAFFCLHELIRILNIYGNSYIMNHSFLAAAHRKSAIVCVFYQLLQDVGKQYQAYDAHHITIEMELSELLGNRFRHNTDPYYHYDQAKLNYEKTISLHSEGSVYKDLSQNMYSLDDDFNDNLTHFCTANERYRMNMGKIEKRIKDINQDLNDSALNQIKTYLYED